MEALKHEKLDIIVVAGQSNAQGCGKGPVTEEYEKDERILQMVDDANPRFIKVDEKDVLELDSPTTNRVEIADEPLEQDGRIGKLPLFFAQEYKKQMLEEDRKILIINGAFGGTGFARDEWGAGNILYMRLVNMIKEALSFNEENRVVAFLWHQGECDTDEIPEYTHEERYQVYKNYLMAQMKDFEKTFCVPNIPFVAGGFCEEWYLTDKVLADCILKATVECCDELNGAFVETHDLLSNNQILNNGDNIHFCRESQHILGKRYFDAYVNIVARKRS